MPHAVDPVRGHGADRPLDRPPTPATSMEFGSPNACNLCHQDKKPAWADEWVRKWYKNDYQAQQSRAPGCSMRHARITGKSFRR